MISFLIAASLLCDTSPPSSSYSSITSNEADYDGNCLKLKGNVVIEHPLGTMEANEACLEKLEDQSEMLRAIYLTESVHIQLKNRGLVHCEKAAFDLHSFEGQLEPKEGEKICYTHFLENDASLQMQSFSALLQFHSEKAQAPILHAIKAEGAVEISYGDGFSLQAECAEFKKAEVHPMITAFSPSGSPCLLQRGKDHVEAEKLQLYPEEAKIAIQHPKGHFPSLALNGQNELFFQCENLVWDQEQQILQFDEAVEIDEPSIGQIHAESGFAQYDEQVGLSFFHLEGEVLLSKNEERCGIADYLNYSQTTSTVTLTADSDKRVLFWDKAKGLAISAHVVEIHRNPETQEEKIKGIGKVRFYFSPEENALLQKFFPHHTIPESYDYLGS